MERHALPVRLVAAFNKEKFKGIAKKILSDYILLLQGIIMGGAPRAPARRFRTALRRTIEYLLLIYPDMLNIQRPFYGGCPFFR